MFKFFFLLLSPLFVLAQSDTTGPYKIGSFIIGKTSVEDFFREADPSLLSFKPDVTLDNYTTIEDDDSYYNHMEDPSNSFFTYKKVYFLKPTYKESLPTNSVLAKINDKTKGFFINEMQFGKYIINNLSLLFYNDTLVYLSYSAGDSVENLLAEKYRHQGSNHKVKNTKSDCKGKFKSGKPVTDREDSYTLLNVEQASFATIALETVFDSDCDASNYVNIEIYDLNRSKEWLLYCSESLRLRTKEFKDKRNNAKSKAMENF